MNALDLRGFDLLYGGTHGAWNAWMIALTCAGGGWAVLALLPMMVWPRRPALRSLTRALAAAIAAQALLVCVIKAATGRVRPWIALGLPAPIGAPHDGSFPSGHAAGSFCVASFLIIALPALCPTTPWRTRTLSVLVFILAAMIGVSRVSLGAHFPRDVLAGSLLGAVVGTAAGRIYLGFYWQPFLSRLEAPTESS